MSTARPRSRPVWVGDEHGPAAQRTLAQPGDRLAHRRQRKRLDPRVLFLACDAPSSCTGQVLVVDGGWTAR